jgi:cytochrome oxidase Cu insertion factor (SCO1/SenC/PrrC family)
MAAKAFRRGANGGLSRHAPSARITATQLTVVVALAAVLGVGGGLGLLFALRAPAAPQAIVSTRHGLDGEATWAAGARPAPAITTLRDQTGRGFSLHGLRGRTVVTVFFDSHCNQACPLAGRTLAAAERGVPAARRPTLVVVSINPRDTPASARAAIRAWGLAGLAPWHWLMGSHAQLAPVWRAYHIFVHPTRADIIHTEALYLIDRRGDERSAYLYPYAPSRVGHDLRRLAAS